MSEPVDCLIVGGGPAGLVAAVYLARFRRSVALVDAGDSRASYIPVTRNVPGFPGGVRGEELLDRLREQAALYDVVPRTGTVSRLERGDDGFVGHVGGERIPSRTVLLATGVVDSGPPLSELRQAVQDGSIRVCPVCDAYEVRDRRIGALGNGQPLVDHAEFLRCYTRQVTLLSWKAISEDDRRCYRKAEHEGFDWVDEAIVALGSDGERAVVTTSGGRRHEFDVVYSLAGSRYRADLALELGASTNSRGELEVDDHLRTSIPGLYAAGDVAEAVNQISVACGQAAIAATEIHNSLPRNWCR
jgi:thioredoxin reductase (NADPH)